MAPLARLSFRATGRPKDIPIEGWVSAESAALSVAAESGRVRRVHLASDYMGKETHIFGAMSPICARNAALFVIKAAVA